MPWSYSSGCGSLSVLEAFGQGLGQLRGARVVVVLARGRGVVAGLALIRDQTVIHKPIVRPRSALALAAAGGALMMVHDWKDRAIWFERGRGSQL